VNWFTETSSPSLIIPRAAQTRKTKGIVMSDYLDNLDVAFENDNVYEWMQDDFDPDRFYMALSQALTQLESLTEEAA
jgi:hypothetical protein